VGLDLAVVNRLSFTYPHADAPALLDVSLRIRDGEKVALLGPSGSGKSTLLRALGGLVPHFHGGRFAGQVVIGGHDTRRARPSELAGCVATVFQDPEDQVVMTTVWNEVAFGLENVGTPSRAIAPRVDEALAAVGAQHLSGRRTAELSSGELQRVCIAAALALRPRLLLLDEPTSQLDPEISESLLEAITGLETAVLLSEQRIGRALALAERVLFLEGGCLLLDAPVDSAVAWLAEHRPDFAPRAERETGVSAREADVLLAVSDVTFSFGSVPVLDGIDLELRAGEVVALRGRNGSGKTTLARLVAGLLEPASGEIRRSGRVCYLAQDPGRYLVRERADDEVALAVGGDQDRARRALARVGLLWAANRHPRDLSSGERERLALAAVAVSEPHVLILDEPTRGIDPVRRRELSDWLLSYAEEGNAVLVVTHDESFPAHRCVRLGVREAANV
jgi:energy-coupling factor transport system ATP-binding protein